MVSSTATTGSPAAKPQKPSFLRRLSLSSTTQTPSAASSSRSVTTLGALQQSGRRDLIAGPAFEALPTGAAPSSFRHVTSADHDQLSGAAPGGASRFSSAGSRPILLETISATSPRRPATKLHPAPAATASRPVPLSSIPAVKPKQTPMTTGIPASPPRQRIHPALASPPKPTTELQFVSSPYPSQNMSPSLAQSSRPMTTRSPSSEVIVADDPRLMHSTMPLNLSRVQRMHVSPAPPSQRQRSAADTIFIQPEGSRHALSFEQTTGQQSALQHTPTRKPMAITRSETFDAMRFEDAQGSDEQAPSKNNGGNRPLLTKAPQSSWMSSSTGRRTPAPVPSGAHKGLPQIGTSAATIPPAGTPLMRSTPSAGADSEASAYAKAVASSSVSKAQLSTSPPYHRQEEPTKDQRRVSRPLPDPPRMPSPLLAGVALSKPMSSSRSGMQILASSRPESHSSDDRTMPIRRGLARMPSVAGPIALDHTAVGHSSNIRTGAIHDPSIGTRGTTREHKNTRSSPSPTFIKFPRSPTLPLLNDPVSHQSPRLKADNVDRFTGTADSSPSAVPVVPKLRASTNLAQSRQPPSGLSPARGRRTASSPYRSPDVRIAAHLAPTPATNLLVDLRARVNSLDPVPARKRKLTIERLMAHPRIQSATLPFLTINSFLSLMGSSEVMRKSFTGESVGRWVMREWGIGVDRERGRSWPNLTVWEGFLESLLHDPTTYSTYPPQWHNLLQHLSLSHTLIVLHLRTLPSAAFPYPSPMPFEDEVGGPIFSVPFSASMVSLSSQGRPRSRLGSTAGSDTGGVALGRMPRQERLIEIVMPEPLAAQSQDGHELAQSSVNSSSSNHLRRRGSVSSMASSASLAFSRIRSNSSAVALDARAESASVSTGPAILMPAGKAGLPPVSYPAAKRYTFRQHGNGPPSAGRRSSESTRPGSVFSIQSSPSISSRARGVRAQPLSMSSKPPSFSVIPTISIAHRASVASTDAVPYGPRSDQGGNSPNERFTSPNNSRRDLLTPPMRSEPAFERPAPYISGRAPVLRIFVPLSDRVQRWPSAEGALQAVRELDKCGATRRLRLGDLVVNTALSQPKTTEHVLLFVPFIKHLLVPLEYRYCQTGHLPSYLDAFTLPPSYYHPFLPSPHIIYLNLAPFAQKAMTSLRLAFDRRDVTVASGAKLSAKRYLHVAGFEVTGSDHVASDWHGMVSFEAEGTAEGKTELERRFGGGDPAKAVMGPWEVVREKSMMGTVWLRLIGELAGTESYI